MDWNIWIRDAQDAISENDLDQIIESSEIYLENQRNIPATLKRATGDTYWQLSCVWRRNAIGITA